MSILKIFAKFELEKNMEGISTRQTQILKSIIEEYIETAMPVGSETIEKKYNLGVSPATIRNDMVSLTNQGFLMQPHSSAGRTPTPKALKFFVDQLMEEKKMSLADEVKAKEEVWDARDNLDDLMEEATQVLAERTGALAIGALGDDNKYWHSGYSNIFSNPEFSDIALCENLFSMLEEAERLHHLFFGRDTLSPVEVLFGEELGWQDLSPIGAVTAHFKVGDKNAALGVVGPYRLSYPRIIPIVKYFGSMVSEIAGR